MLLIYSTGYRLLVEAAAKMPNVSYREITRFLQSIGYQYQGTSGSHEKWTHPITNHSISIKAESFWGSNAKNIAEYIVKQVGLRPGDFAKMWQDKKRVAKTPCLM